MKLPRRAFLKLAGGAAALPAFPRLARAQTYPARPVRMIVAVAAGGGTDILARTICQWLTEKLGQSFVVENRPGGGNNIGTEAAIRSPADGYTLQMANSVNTINAGLYDKLSFDFVNDIAPVSAVTRAALVLMVNPSFPARTVPEFVAYAKANPEKVNMGSGGMGSTGHVSWELFQMMAGFKVVHVPYRGEAPALTDLLGGQVQVSFTTITSAIQYLRADKLRALAVSTAKRSELLPDVPTLADFLPGYDAASWNGVIAPKGTPADIVERLNKEINAALADPKMKAKLADVGAEPFAGSSAAFRKFIVEEADKWTRVIKFSGAKPG